eukprot:gene8191-9069_t
MAVGVEPPPMEVNNNPRNEEIQMTKTSEEVDANDKQEDTLTPYEQLTHDLAHDEKIAKEISSGKRIGFYRIRGDLGSGNFSQVKLGYHCLAKEKVAIKILDKTKLDQKTQRLLSREISCMEKLRHPNIIRLYEVIETITKLYMIIEYASGGELFHKILNEGKLPERLAKKYFSQVVSAVQHMHDSGVIHRDIKAENVFLSNLGVVKLGDFGFSTVSSQNEALSTFCGSPPYAAPELFKDDSYIGSCVDVWALGILLYFMVCGMMPFRAETVGKLKRKILEGTYTIPDYVTDSCKFLIKQILRPVASDRFTIYEVMRCLWLEGIEFPKTHRKFEKKPSLQSSSSSMEEREANKSLRYIGVPTELIEKASSDAKCNVTGTYRILLHQIQRRNFERFIANVQAARREKERPRANTLEYASPEAKPSAGQKSNSNPDVFCVSDMRSQKELSVVKKAGSETSEKTLWDIAIEERNKLEKMEKQGQCDPTNSAIENNMLVCGSAESGKTSIILRFLDRDEKPKPTVALDYTFARRAKGHNMASNLKDVCHIWELGGGTSISQLVEVAITPKNISNLSVVMVLDLSKPNYLWQTQEVLMKQIRSCINRAIKEASKEEPNISKVQNGKTWERIGVNHTELEPEKKKMLCKTLRFLAHKNGATLQFSSNKIDNLSSKTRFIMGNLAFHTNVGKSLSTDHNKPLMINVGQDKFDEIGAPQISSERLGRIKGGTPYDLWKEAYAEVFPPAKNEDLNLGADPTTDSRFAEPIVDAMRAQKDEELARYRKDMQRKSKQSGLV